ncbi:MAG TPA: histidine kinase dimerization/phosphoacceptor domain -containing protein [Phenylobacterium sp.]
MAAHTKLQPNDPSLSLVLAMVCASPTPLLLLDGDCKILAASSSFCDVFQIDPTDAIGQSLFSLGNGQWEVPQLRSLMSATSSGDSQVDAYEAELRTQGGELRCIVLNVRKLVYGDEANVRLLVAVSDVTEARASAARDRELAQAHALLIAETRHRIANSLQIIASVMMLNARRTSSEETRGQLRDAHNRVLSVADLQQQLAGSSEAEVAIRPYLTRLCQTITASMIADPEALAITVTAPEVSIDPDVSISLGLIVTELVINALKHGFPDGAGGSIAVSYAREGQNWTLSVSDTGVGMPKRTKAMAGLGTSIVQALARQLRARVEVSAMRPGTRVSIVHSAAEQVAPQTEPALPEVAI